MKSKRVLVIDNDRFSLSVLYRLVSDLGCEPILCSTAEAARTLLFADNAGVVIYNQDLDAEWGFSVVDNLRAYENTADLPVILLSQTNSRYGPRVEEDDNATVCFQKPIAIEPFVSHFRDLIDRN